MMMMIYISNQSATNKSFPVTGVFSRISTTDLTLLCGIGVVVVAVLPFSA
jgi:hypothetical protein